MGAGGRERATTGEAPIARFERDEAHRLKPLGGQPAFSLRETEALEILRAGDVLLGAALASQSLDRVGCGRGDMARQ